MCSIGVSERWIFLLEAEPSGESVKRKNDYVCPSVGKPMNNQGLAGWLLPHGLARYTESLGRWPLCWQENWISKGERGGFARRSLPPSIVSGRELAQHSEQLELPKDVICTRLLIKSKSERADREQGKRQRTFFALFTRSSTSPLRFST